MTPGPDPFPPDGTEVPDLAKELKRSLAERIATAETDVRRAELAESTRPPSPRECRDALRADPPRNLRQLLPPRPDAVHRLRAWRRPVSVRVALSRARLERRRG